jgi:hypothetical protein
VAPQRNEEQEGEGETESVHNPFQPFHRKLQEEEDPFDDDLYNLAATATAAGLAWHQQQQGSDGTNSGQACTG